MNTEKSAPPKGVYILPNLITTAALFSGFYAIVAAMNGRFEVAAVAVFVAMVLDGADGRVARWTNTQSDFGAQYDSLSDLVSFGVAPAVVIYQWALVHMAVESAAWGKLGWMAAFIYVACAALRLARFNVQIEEVDKRYFVGLPSPASAAIMVGMVWFFDDLDVTGRSVQIPALILTISAGLLMVSNVLYTSFKDFDYRSKVPYLAILAVVLAFALAAIDPPKVLFAAFLVYALSGPVYWVLRKLGYVKTIPTISLTLDDDEDDTPAKSGDKH
ncbi:CDP-diacylglycerol--serine O-phosphatidyltransferase [Leucothrix mucor]|jgi:CDP-diacylglycerol--serine O-phosphatidyltransferase|uniref:CDP-diacylglycerol--serine O-phosphatidyltransferase n=1 Tax=Leucothrix mucor TaxID=45248 RepID=UPI0003B4C83E|nr:CDP-diacylglycerol--serine O-phosphatidyltransferase [Leucothrix mucor]